MGLFSKKKKTVTVEETVTTTTTEVNNEESFAQVAPKNAGTYAHDVEGYSDDDIDTIFDGDPEAYWNID